MDANYIRANVVNAGYISSLEVVSKKVATATIGRRIVIENNSLKYFNTNGGLAIELKETDGIVAHAAALAILLRHDVVADHPPRFAHIELVRPAAVVGEFVLGQAEALHVFAHLLGDAGIGGKEVKQAAMIVFVLLCDLLALRVGSLRPCV